MKNKENNIELEVGIPQVSYREAPTRKVSFNHRHKKQTGGSGQYAHVIMRVEPNPGKGFEFADNTTGGVIPREYIPAIRKGAVEVMAAGVLADYQAVDVRVTLIDGSSHEVDSSDLAFRQAAVFCFRQAFLEAEPRLLEPIMTVDIATPDEYIGDIVGDLSRRRGKVLNLRRFRKGSQKIEAEAPLMEMFGYATALRSLSSGRANHSMEIKQFAPLPAALMESVLEEAHRRMRGAA